MTGNLKLLCNFVEKFMGTVHFGNDQFAPILGKEMSLSTGFTTSKASITISSQLVNFVIRIWRLLSGSLHVLLEIFRSTEFLNKTLNAFFKEEGIEHQTSTARTPEQNGVVERRNRTLVEAARTMLSASYWWDTRLSQRDIVSTIREQG
nr:ribonuclease H-like domain-containing protein [Tanacetum cinerariifolium]